MRDIARTATIAVFAATYVGLALGRLPGLRIDRAGIALVGASLMLAAGVLSLDEAARAVDFPTLALLLGMMIVVANLRLSGVFRLASGWIVAAARRPLAMLTSITLVSGVFSAFLLNDAICLAMTPLVIEVVRRLDRDPVPYLLAVAMASNIGSAATITGNPQNILIGTFSGIPYAAFAARLSPLAAIGLLLTVLLVAALHPAEFRCDRLSPAPAPPPPHLHRPLAAKSVVVVVAMIAAFFAGAPPAEVALVAGALLLLTRVVAAHRIYREIDWPLLLLFAGLFVVVAGFEKATLTPPAIGVVSALGLGRPWVLGSVTAALSNLVSNVPAVLVLKPIVGRLAEPTRAWLIIAMASTFAGNLTVLGSIANLIVVQLARSQGVAIGFWQYFRVGAPLTLLTIVLGLCWL